MSIDRPNPATSSATAASAADEQNRPPRLPRWTRQEILVLIQGKKVTEGLRGPARGAEPKWATVSAYCRRHGIDRGPVQCRKRWSNLAGDFKKIREWESFWSMRNDARRESGLPGFFDREVYDILDGLQNKLIEVFEQNSRMLTAQLEAQNMNCRLDREQRKEQVDGLLGVLNKFADAISRIADKF
ncbi:hypothetical protein QJS04_geneDACA020976 [Acorus gramineus]|uniref:Myb-like domain-containing protein n=1 Tax=Acorus gramineus TaxID=55184 RepID=A0AAV9B0D6_ACOGR|nr:hypothetical protein QJS04_geneDACA020976 [Acorus gramineus]